MELSRRGFLRVSAVGAAGVLLAACAPKVVEKVVKETVLVEKPVEKEVTKIVKEAVTVVAEAAPAELQFLRQAEVITPGEPVAVLGDRFHEGDPNIKVKH